MQTKTTKIILSLLFAGLLIVPVTLSTVVFGANLSSNLSVFTLYENPAQGPTETRFILKLVPEPTDQVTTSFTTNGECAIGHNFVDYGGGGAIVTKNDSLSIGVRIINDVEGEGEHSCDIRFSSVSQYDSEYSKPVVVEYSILIIDDDLVVPYQYSISTLTSGRLTEGLDSVEQYQIDISRTPAYDIVINAQVGEQCDLLVGVPQRRVKSATKSFKAGSTDPVRFTLAPVDDAVFEGIHQCSVQHISSTSDVKFAGLTVGSYVTTILDNETNQNIPDDREYEGGLIYYLDANADGVEDTTQPQVVSFIHPKNGARQALVLTDVEGALLAGCKFTSDVTVSEFEGGSSLISTYGRISTAVSCNGDQDYRIQWLLDQYIESALDWDMYEELGDGSLNKVPATSGVFELGADFTTALSIDLDSEGDITFVQTDGVQASGPVSSSESLAADIQNTRLNILALVSGASAAMVILWLVYRRYFSLPDTVKSRFPRVDRF